MIDHLETWLWRGYARVYDALTGVAGYQEMLTRLDEAIGPVQGRVVVEIGCGTGNLLQLLHRQQPKALHGIDASPQMLAVADAKLNTPGLTLEHADAGLALARRRDATVDVLVASNVLYALPDRVGFWQQAARVLRPDGRIVISNPDRPGFAPAVRQQWRQRGLRGFLDPRLPLVIVLNLAIDALARFERYEFSSWSELVAEAERAGLPHARLHSRCYGGPDDGMNVVGVFSRQ